jgi:hypothetical protein
MRLHRLLRTTLRSLIDPRNNRKVLPSAPARVHHALHSHSIQAALFAIPNHEVVQFERAPKR